MYWVMHSIYFMNMFPHILWSVCPTFVQWRMGVEINAEEVRQGGQTVINMSINMYSYGTKGLIFHLVIILV